MTENNELQLKYPCQWVYKIIGVDTERMKTAVKSIIKAESVEIEASRESKSGKYVSLNISLVVQSDDERKRIFTLLGQQSDIKMVL
jgi:putative lipoic acid-binding regulatory protein